MKNIARHFAAYIMRGRLHAMIVTTACAVLSLIVFPFVFPLSLMSAACVALVTLRQGARSGFFIIAGATLISGVTAVAAASQMNLALSFVAMYVLIIWFPIWIVSVVLRYTRALDVTLVCAAALGIFVIIGMHLYIGDLTAWWTNILKKMFEPVLQDSRLSPDEINGLIEGMAGQMTGSLAAGFVLGNMLSLFIGRWWQAMLYNPGGFRREFYTLRLDRRIAMISAVIGLAAFIPVEKLADVSHDIFIVIVAAYMLHGLSLLHTAVSAFGMHGVWLGVVYVMIVFLPPARLLLAAAGFADSWIDLRPRIAARAGKEKERGNKDPD